MELDKGEKADYSQFKPMHSFGQMQVSEIHAAKETQEEENQSIHRSR